MANIEEWGIGDKGFYCPTYEEILNDKIKRAKELFGDDISTNGQTILGKFLRIQAKVDRKIYETAEKVYYSFSPTTATGVSLDRVCAFARVKRKTAECAVHTLRVYGIKDYTIKSGTQFRSEAGVTFYAVEDSVIEHEEQAQEGTVLYYADTIVQCTEAGVIGNVTNINNTALANHNIDYVRYINTLSEGTDTEKDAEERERFNNTIEGLGQNTASSIVANVLKLNDVFSCVVKNNTSESDLVISDDFIIAKDTYAVVVYANGNPDSEIAAAIFEKQPFGIRQSGLEVVTIKDEAGEYHNIKFTYVKEKSVEVVVECYVTSDFELTGVTKMRENILNYINTLGIEKNLVYSKLYQKIFEIIGVDDVPVLTVNGGTGNIEASLMEIIRCTPENIHITVTEV